MDFSEDDATNRIDELFEQCRLQHRESYPASSLDFDGLNLTKRLKYGRRPHARGHFADVYRGQVAVKVLKLPEYGPHNDDIYRNTVLRFFREMSCWSKLNHFNVINMLGFTLEDGNIGLVSHWYEHGNLVQYLRNRADASKPNLMLDVVEGTHYLHTCPSPLVHGDLKAVNVLVDPNGIARLADFGISKQIDDMNRKTNFTTTGGVTGTTPWMAPELLTGLSLSFASDIYSLAGVLLEICCPGKTPYHYMTLPQDMILAKLQGELPQRLHYSEMAWDDGLWELFCACWNQDPTKRPVVTKLSQSLYKECHLSPRVDQNIVARPPEYCQLCRLSTSPSQMNDQSVAAFSMDATTSLWLSAGCSVHQRIDNRPQLADSSALTTRIATYVPRLLDGWLNASEGNRGLSAPSVYKSSDSTKQKLNPTSRDIKALKNVWASFDRRGTGYIPQMHFVPFFAMLSGGFEVRTYPNEFRLRNIVAAARASHDPRIAYRAPIVWGIDMWKLAEVLNKMDRHEIRYRRNLYARLYHELLLIAEPGKGISFNSMLSLLTRYKFIDDGNALSPAELTRRWAITDRVTETVKLDGIRSFLKMLYYRRRFLGLLEARELDRTAQ